MGTVEAADEVLVGAPLAELALVVQGAQDAAGAVDERDALGVVSVVDGKAEPLRIEEPLLLLEEHAGEELLNRLVRVVDQQLLEAVALHVLEAEDVEDADAPGAGAAAADGLVHGAEHPVEEHGVQQLADRVPRGGGLERAQPHDDALPRHLHRARRDGALEYLRVQLEQVTALARQRVAPLREDRALAALALAERHVAEVQDARRAAQHAADLLRRQPDRGHRVQRALQPVQVVLAAQAQRLSGDAARRGEGPFAAGEGHLIGVGDAVRGEQVGRAGGEQSVEDVEVSLAERLHDDARLLQEVRLDAHAADGAAGAEVQLDELAEARGVVVAGRFRVAEGLEQRVALEHAARVAVLGGGGAALPSAAGRAVHLGAGEGEELHDLLRALRLAGAALAADEDGVLQALVPHAPRSLRERGVQAARLRVSLLERLHHGAVRVRRDAVDVRRLVDEVAVAVLVRREVQLERLVGVQVREHAERVDREQQPRPEARVDLVLHEALLEDLDDRVLAEQVHRAQIVRGVRVERLEALHDLPAVVLRVVVEGHEAPGRQEEVQRHEVRDLLAARRAPHDARAARALRPLELGQLALVQLIVERVLLLLLVELPARRLVQVQLR